MKSGLRLSNVLLWGMLALAILLISALFIREQALKSNLPVFGQVDPFTLTNQLGNTVTASDLAGKVWVADIVFTRCGGPCPRMTEQMAKIQNEFKDNPGLHFVTLTTDPDYDTPEVMRKWSGKFGADPERWHFLTGSKPEIKAVAVGSLKLTADEKEEKTREAENDLFIHSTYFVLMDKRGRTRGVYESLEPQQMTKLQQDIKSLLRERP